MPALNYDFTKFEVYKKLNIDDVIIPTTDDAAWEYFCEHRWVYDKLLLADVNDIPCGPYGVYPTEYPVIVKPIVNLMGGGYGIRKVDNEKDLERWLLPELFWMNHFKGEHLSYDCVVKDGRVLYMEIFKGHVLRDGMFDFWETVTHEVGSAQINNIVNWTEANLPGYTGCSCYETINDNMIEAHLRMGDIDRFMNRTLMQSIVNLYRDGSWEYQEKEYRKYYLFAVFAPYTQEVNISKRLLDQAEKDCVFFQIDSSDGELANPPAGKRIFALGTWDRDVGVRIRNKLINNINPPIPDEYVLPLYGYKSD